MMISGGTPSLRQAAATFWMGSGVTAPRRALSAPAPPARLPAPVVVLNKGIFRVTAN